MLAHNLVIALSESSDLMRHCDLLTAPAGNARQGQIDEAKAAGMDEVVIKPYRLDDLLVKIEEMMKLRVSSASTAARAAARVVNEVGDGSMETE